MGKVMSCKMLNSACVWRHLQRRKEPSLGTRVVATEWRQQRNRGSVPARGMIFFLIIHLDSGGHLDSFSKGTGLNWPGLKASNPPISSSNVTNYFSSSPSTLAFMMSSETNKFGGKGNKYLYNRKLTRICGPTHTERGCWRRLADLLLKNTRAGDGAVGWDTKLRVGRSRVRFTMVSLEFFIDIILPATLWPWSWPNF
jgi:hypothetical protein